MMLGVLHLCLHWALLFFPTMVLANTHSKCFCKLNTQSSKCLTTKACDIYRTSKEKFNKDPSKVNITTYFGHVCGATEPEESGRVWFTKALGGNEFEQACWEAQSSGACPESAGGNVESVCP
ncbi:hypothetical protein LX32DRAFT_387407 [Colletotrichum zoysiae]|uniref:Uncharacterized protein n=1 Tax=Colletotrichum zoysiae TaxID=1216348 RepID=A0AAD9HGS9_9PEZI|nr:hypothetical protein LX32DRAFT_387407 [Colletotrichum zoysiae]